MTTTGTTVRSGRPAGGRIAPHALFVVPEGVKLLDAEQLLRLEQAFSRWRAAAATPHAEISRGRMWLLFQLLRHTGARLGEVQALDVRTDVCLQTGSARFGHNGRMREVPLPRALCREIDRLLNGVSGGGFGEYPFGVDQGYVRRVFYARAEECGVPRDMATPRVLRNTRAVELLRSGVPLAVVREVLGQASADLAAVLQNYSSGDMRAIVRRLAMDAGERSSARNSFRGHVSAIRTDAIMAEVSLCTVGGHTVSALITMESLRALELEPDSPVGATVKAPYVDVRLCAPGSADGDTGGSGRPNCMTAAVTQVRSSGVMAEVMGACADGTQLCALLSISDAERMGLVSSEAGAGQDVAAPGVKGMTAEFFFKPLSVVLHTV
ncbi:TOBE domain-containing protein [Oleidesulfovibrio alaskensis]|uniref:TOBE domain-containing protein n=1 Tax=Oleidesulfovibrio alaskensis TaxID=58180 RepID=UPI000425CEE1|nr:TOBE domain-containing protein [Oleidesulfovibrio alaskensis]